MNALATEGLFSYGAGPAERGIPSPELPLTDERVDQIFAGIVEGLEDTVPAEVKTDSQLTPSYKGGMPGELQPTGRNNPF